MPTPHALLLDAGNTLFRERTSRARVYADVAARHGLRVVPADMAAAMAAAHAELPEMVDGHFRYTHGWFARFIEHVFARCGYHGPTERISRDLFAAFDEPGTFTLFAEVRPVVKRLKGAGVPLAVVSNYSPRLHGLLGRLGLLRDFDAVVISAVLKLEKPDAGIFRAALHELGVEPERAVHVGDHPLKDADGANAAGLRGVLLDRDQAHPEHPDRISSLRESLAWFGIDARGIP